MQNDNNSTVDHVSVQQFSMGDSVLNALGNVQPGIRLIDHNLDKTQATSSESSTLPKNRYLFEGEIARGGMGAVLRCWDQDLGREIAVKVMLENHRGKTELVQRFVDEAQIAGQLQHPGIAPIYELGKFPDLRPYFSMKLIRGETLAKLLTGRTAPSTEYPKYLKIFEQICQTMAYAHARGVIHRDLKPLNVMVGAFGEVQVMDWGLAKVLMRRRGTEFVDHQQRHDPNQEVIRRHRSSGQASDIPGTQAGTVSGTPAYMAPEQARGEIEQIDERADVFGLGAILCEILTGKPAYYGRSSQELLQLASQAKLDDAYSRLEQCGADTELTALAKRCLAPNREDRVRHAGELASQLTKYLNSVEERLKNAELTAVEVRTKAEEERKRRQVTNRLTASILLTLFVGLVVSLWQMNRALTAEELAKANESIAKTERDAKELARSRAIQSANAERVAKEQAEKRLVQIQKGVDLIGSIFNDLDPRTITRRGDKLELVLGKRLTSAADQLEGDLIGDSLVVADLQQTLGSALKNLGEYPEAITLFEKSWKTRVKELGHHHSHTLASQANLADGYRVAGKLELAIPLLEKSQLDSAKHLGNEHLDSLTAVSNLAAGLEAIGKVERAISLLTEALEIAKRKKGPNHSLTLGIMNNLAVCYRSSGKVDLAIPLYRDALEARRKSLGPTHPATLSTRDNLSEAYLQKGHFKLAIPLMEESMNETRAKLGLDHPETLTSMNNLATAYHSAGLLEKSLNLHQTILPLRKQKLGAEHPETLVTMSNLALMYRVMGQLDKSIDQFEAILKVRKAKLGLDHPDTLTGMGNLAAALREAGQLERALPLLKETLEAMTKKHGVNHPHTAITMNNLAKGYMDANKLDLAIPLFQETVKVNLRVFGVDHPNTLTTMNNLAVAYQSAGDLNSAIQLAEETLSKRRAKLGNQHPLTLTSINNLASIQNDCSNLKTAIKLYEEVVASAKDVWGPTHPNTIGVTQNYFGVLEKDNQWLKGAKCRQEFLPIERQVFARNKTRLIKALVNVGYAEIKANQAEMAALHLREALSLQEEKEPDAWQTYNTKSILGEALFLLNKQNDAEPLLLVGYLGMKERMTKISKENQSNLGDAAKRLTQFYQAAGKAEDAAKWKKEWESLVTPGK